MSKTIVFFGNERLATGVATDAPTLRALVEARYNVATVVSNYTESQSRSARQLEIKAVAEQYDIPVILPNKPLEIKTQLEELHADIGVLVAYGKIVPQKIIDVFPRGIVNIHPSLLPLHRGPTPIESVILNGATETGVSLMQLAKEMDAGPVFVQKKVQLTGSESKQQLATELLNLGKDLLIAYLPAIIDGTLIATPQDDAHVIYDSLITKNDGLIDWHKPAKQIEREIRAFMNWPKSHTLLADKEVVLTKCHIHNGNVSGAPGSTFINDKHLIITCGEGALAIDQIRPNGKPDMKIEAFLAGYGKLLKTS